MPFLSAQIGQTIVSNHLLTPFQPHHAHPSHSLECVKTYCQYDCDPKCCSLSTFAEQQSCLEGGTNTPTTTDQNYVACGTVQAIISACQSAIPSFSSAPISELESCFCYKKGDIFDPDPFDNGIVGCVNYFSTANPTLVPVATSYLGFCTIYQGALSSALASQAASTAPPSAAASTAAQSAAASTSLHRSSPPESTISSSTSEPHPRGSQTSSTGTSPAQTSETATATPKSGSPRVSTSMGEVSR
jgi:hypothetical protein